MKKYNCVSPMEFKLEKNNQRDAYTETPLLKMCNIYIFLVVIVLVHYIWFA